MNITRVNKNVIFYVVFSILFASVAFGGPDLRYYKGHVNGEFSGIQKIDPQMFSANPTNSLYYMEIWFHEFHFEEEGIILNINFQMHNLGVAKRYCDVFIMVSDKKSGLVLEKETFSPEKVEVSADGFSIEAGQNSISLVDDKYYIKCRGEKIIVDLTCDILVGSFQLGDGFVIYSKQTEAARHSLPFPLARAKGKVTYNKSYNEVSGFGSLNHEWQQLSPLQYMTKLRIFYIYNDDYAMYISSVTSKALNESWVQRLTLAEKGEIVFSSHDFKLTELDTRKVSNAKVPLPRKYKVEAIHGENKLTGEITVTNVQEKEEILKDYNPLFRELAYLIINETWSYRFWMDYELTLERKGEIKTFTGKGVGNFVDSIK